MHYQYYSLVVCFFWINIGYKKSSQFLESFCGLDGTRTLLGEPCRCGTSAKYFYLC